MKTAVILSTASLAAAFVIPGNNQQILPAFSDDGLTSVQDAGAGEVVRPPPPPPPPPPAKDLLEDPRLGDYQHHAEEEEGNGNEEPNQKWSGIAGLVEGLENSVRYFEELDLQWLGRSDEFSFGREIDVEETRRQGKEMREKFGGDDDQVGEEHHEKHYDKHHDDEHHDDGHHDKHDGKHHKDPHGDGHAPDEFDIPPCPHHAGHHGRRPGFLSKAIGHLKHMLGFPAPKFEDRPDHPHHPGKPHHPHDPKDPYHPHDPKDPHHPDHPHGPHHEHSPRTIYETISNSEHTTIFTRIINKYDDVVKYLNSTSSSNYTVFVPVDSAFEGFHHPHHNISKKAILHWLEYHISPEVYTLHDFFDVQTVPTLTKEETSNKFPQRISTSLTRKGLTLNFHSHVIRPDIHATNGIIHAIDNLLMPALSTKTTIELVPSLFSTLDLALIKTGLIDELDPSNTKTSTGGTFFAPTNQAFAKLPAKISAFLFSSAGEKYLKALLKYHLVPGHVVFTDAYYKPKSDDGDDEEEMSLLAKKHLDLPTALKDKGVSIDIRNFHRLTLMTVNKRTPVSVANVPVKEGVIHLVSSVLIPPHEHHHSDNQGHGNEISVQEFMDRLEAYLE